METEQQPNANKALTHEGFSLDGVDPEEAYALGVADGTAGLPPTEPPALSAFEFGLCQEALTFYLKNRIVPEAGVRRALERARLLAYWHGVVQGGY